MQKTRMQDKTEFATIATAAVLYFSALVMFSYWFTQS
jgi:hypothetical protein